VSPAAGSDALIAAPEGFGERLGVPFFDRPPRDVAVELLGCALTVDGCGGVIVETEAYEQDDPACHAFIGRTKRTEVLFGAPGRAYVYLSYGIHSLFNVVTRPDGVAAAVLIRALEPRWELGAMAARRHNAREAELCSGPGKLTEALGIDLAHNDADLGAPPFGLFARPPGQPSPAVVAGPRIGITKGAELPWRYCVAASPWLSRRAG
jgi:DNA-3-methyladenine glycosylase